MRRWKKQLIAEARAALRKEEHCHAGQRCQPLTGDFLLGCRGSRVDNGEDEAQGAWKNFPPCYGNKFHWNLSTALWLSTKLILKPTEVFSLKVLLLAPFLEKILHKLPLNYPSNVDISQWSWNTPQKGRGRQNPASQEEHCGLEPSSNCYQSA